MKLLIKKKKYERMKEEYKVEINKEEEDEKKKMIEI